MASAKEFEEFARALRVCMRFASGTRDQRIREKLIEIARQWVQLVLDEEDISAIASRFSPNFAAGILRLPLPD